MKPPRFTYHDPHTRDEVLALLEHYADDAKVLAGGQSLVPLLNMRLAQPAHLVDINHLSDLAYIREVDGGLAIGALTRYRDLERSPLVRQHCPLLAEALPLIGHAPIRSRGTIGGSLAHADPTAELPAVLVALDGRIRAESRTSSRAIAAESFFVSQLQTALEHTELLTEVWFPSAPPRSSAVFIEVSRRHGDYALVGAAVQLALDIGNAIIAAHLAFIGVGITPVRARIAEQLLIGKQPDQAVFTSAATLACSALTPETDVHASAEYRRDVAATLLIRALHLATEHVRQGGNHD